MTPKTSAGAGSQLPPCGMNEKSSEKNRDENAVTDASQETNDQTKDGSESIVKKEPVNLEDCPASPQIQHPIYQQFYIPHLTPLQGGGFYSYGGSQVTPEPPSPATPGYDVNSFLQHQAALGVHPGNPFGSPALYGTIPPQSPLSPKHTIAGLIPPPSPLFPRAAVGNYDHQTLPSDSNVIQRMQGQTSASTLSGSYTNPTSLGTSTGTPGFGSAYPGYAVPGSYASVLRGSGTGNEPSAEEFGWADRSTSQQPLYAQASPHQGPALYHAVSRATMNNRSYSLDEMLPPSALDAQDQVNTTYSPYTINQGGPANALFPHQQSWGYGTTGEMFSSPHSPLQPRQNSQIQGQFLGSLPTMGPPQMHQMGHFMGQIFCPTSSPGPPIQTTPSTKGPDGANLFIFHIPNHFTNVDMFRLFAQYGNLLSVRIMVEKETGRSRGFGFVSYDLPQSAALAIKELNGFPIGNKRLKVQHKQIRDPIRTSFESPDGGYMPHAPDFHDGSTGEHPVLLDTQWFDSMSSIPGGSYAEPQHMQQQEQQSTAEHAPDAVGPIVGKSNDEPSSTLPSLEPLRAALPDVAAPVGIAE